MGTSKRIFVLLIALAVGPAWAQKPARHASAAQTSVQSPLEPAEKLLQSGQFSEAEEKLQPLASSQARNPQFWFDLGFAQSHQEKTKEAVASYQEAAQLAPKWFEANLNLGLALAKSGENASAVAVL